jgi:hypothetical protein
LRAPRAFSVRSDADYVGLLGRLRDLGMVDYTTTPKVVNGAFATPKDEGRQRLVIDARPANAAFAASAQVVLPAPDLLARLEVPEGGLLYAAKVDLDNYYHRLRMPSWMWPFFALPAVRAEDVGMELVFGVGTKIFPCCTTLPMGWSHSVFLAQAVHEHQATGQGGLVAADQLTRNGDFRVNRPRWFIYIDDLILVGLHQHVPKLRGIQDTYVGAMGVIGLPHKPSKLVRPSCDGVVCIGVEVHGRNGTVGVAPASLATLSARTAAMVRGGLCRGRFMAELVGCWSWAFQARRCAYSVFSAVYRFSEAAGRAVFEVWPSVARELQMAVALAPLLFTRIAAPWCSGVVATDASEHGGGVVATEQAPPAVASAAHGPFPGAEVAHTTPGGFPQTRWATIVACPWSRPEHINVLEMRALLLGLEWQLSRPRAHGTRLLFWADSSVVVGAVRKGRSSSFALLTLLRRLTALSMAMDVQVHVNWVPTEINPADGPSRRHTGAGRR